MCPTVRRRTLLGAGLAAAAAGTGTAAGCSDDDSDFEPPEPENGAFALTGVRIFDGEEFIDADTVIVEDGEITGVGTDLDVGDIPAADAGGRTLLPGLIDAHVHHAHSHAGPALRFGTTSMLEMGHPSNDRFVEHIREIRDDREQFAEADVWTGGTFVTVEGGHTTGNGDFPLVDDDTDIDEFIAERVAYGADYVKLIVESGWDDPLPTLSPEQVEAIVEAVHSHDLLAVAHAVSWPDVQTTTETGVDVLAHSPTGGPVDAEIVADIAERGIAVIATLTLASQGCAHDVGELADDAELEPYLPAGALAELGRHEPSECHTELFQQNLDAVTALHEAGVPILAGTDVNMHDPDIVAGVSMFHEMELLHEAGLSLPDVLKAATSAPADVFGLDDRGRVAEGLRADLLLVDADLDEAAPEPTDVVAIWKNGHLVEREVS